MDTQLDRLRWLEETIKQAGDIALRFTAEGFKVTEKKPEDLLTEADMAIDTFLKTTLLEAFPTYGWLSEETVDSSERLNKDYIWIVDPIDGTWDYVHGTKNYAISIGLVHKGEPILATVYNPARCELMSAAKGYGTWLNGQKASPSQAPLSKSTWLISATETRKGLWKGLEESLDLQPVGSIAYKLALLGVGKTDIVASLQPKNEWDICAGQLICEEAGCIFTDLQGDAVSYNKQDVLLKGGLIAAPPQHFEQVKSILNNHLNKKGA